MPKAKHTAVIFDLGGVLIDWNPRYLYRKRFGGDEAAMEHFLTHVCTPEWNIRQDAGRTFAEASELLCRSHPQLRAHIEAWLPGFDDMMAGEIQGSVDILAELRARGTPIYALTNWSAETFPCALERFEFLGWFADIVVSGKLQLIKPDPAIYRHLLTTHGLQAEQSIFIDDAPHNVAGAAAVGIHALQFTSPDALRQQLVELGMLG
ncbi:MAG TPA: HAD family phosphatase [Polyangiales bacterium]|nr:HAD family phosphatase [Polyangiales bacterium]